MFVKLKKIYEEYWLDIGVALLVALLLGSGLLLIKISGQEKKEIEISGGEVEAADENKTEVKSAKEESGLININTASQAELEKLPGIGEKTAEKIIEYREENGPFQSIEDLKNVSGIGEAKHSEVEDLITAE